MNNKYCLSQLFINNYYYKYLSTIGTFIYSQHSQSKQTEANTLNNFKRKHGGNRVIIQNISQT